MIKDYKEFYDQVYSQDTQIPDDVTDGWIQWKGTDVCMDIHCVCGHHGHVDEDAFFYFFECPSCHRKYAVGANVKFIELTPEQVEYAKEHCTEFRTCDLED